MIKLSPTEKVLDQHINQVVGQILSDGRYIKDVTENLVNEDIVKYDDGTVITDPVEKADDILAVAKHIKRLAIQYQALCNVDNQIIIKNNKKAAEGATTSTLDTIND